MLKTGQAIELQKKTELILTKLAEYYPVAVTKLKYDNPFQLFVATVLSAQTTDEQVNKITAELFTTVNDINQMARMKPAELQPLLKSCGLYRHKSKYLIEASKMIVEKYGGEVPENFNELIKLPGVGRKTANVIISSAFGKPALAVDTHVFRVSRRLGIAVGKSAEKVEEELKAIIPVESWNFVHHRLISHGRAICHARNPKCFRCFLQFLCSYEPERSVLNDLGKNIQRAIKT